MINDDVCNFDVKTVYGFRDNFDFLSNFYDLETHIKDDEYSDISYSTIEHYYQSHKVYSHDCKYMISNHPKKGLKNFVNSLHEATIYCNRVKVNRNRQLAINVMKSGLMFKFSKHNPTLRRKLIDTDGIELVEYNTWGDKFFGVDIRTGKGYNHLGKILMDIRTFIIQNEMKN